MDQIDTTSARIDALKVKGHLTMQASFSELEYAAKKKVTRHDRFLGEMEVITPWSALTAEIEPFYPKGEGRGRLLKGSQWYFGMKAHIGVDADFRYYPYPGDHPGQRQ